jgi:hypothetical protein
MIKTQIMLEIKVFFEKKTLKIDFWKKKLSQQAY